MKEILELIEKADPENIDDLNEIDARVWCWIEGKTYEYNFRNNMFYLCVKTIEDNVTTCIPNYTRSRDELKKIRPDGWTFSIEKHGDNIFTCKYGDKIKPPFHNTEELAELNCLILAIQYERENP